MIGIRSFPSSTDIEYGRIACLVTLPGTGGRRRAEYIGQCHVVPSSRMTHAPLPCTDEFGTAGLLLWSDVLEHDGVLVHAFAIGIDSRQDFVIIESREFDVGRYTPGIARGGSVGHIGRLGSGMKVGGSAQPVQGGAPSEEALHILGCDAAEQQAAWQIKYHGCETMAADVRAFPNILAVAEPVEERPAFDRAALVAFAIRTDQRDMASPGSELRKMTPSDVGPIPGEELV